MAAVAVVASLPPALSFPRDKGRAVDVRQSDPSIRQTLGS